MKRVFCLNNISKVGLSALPKDYVVTDDAAAEAILVRSAVMHEMKLAPSVLAIARAGAGVNNIPLDAYAKEGVVVFNTPGANANAVKELTIAAMLLAARDIHGGMKWIEANKNDADIAKSVEKAKKAYAGTEIMHKTLGIFGLGAVGSLIAGAAGALGMHVVGYEPYAPAIEKNRHLLPADIELVDAPAKLYAKADYISLNVPLNDKTRGMIDQKALSLMKDGVIVLNIARAAIVDDAAMKEALAAGKVRRYVTDFPTYASANTAGVLAIPHLGASTEEAEDNCARMAALEVSDYIDNGNIVNSVNYPAVSLGRKGKDHRVLVLHLAEAADAVKKALGPVVSLQSGIRNGYGAILADMKAMPDLAAVKAIEGVLRVRSI